MKDQKKRITIPDIRKHPWILKSSRQIPSKEGNCNNEISVSEEDMEKAVKTYQTPIHILVSVIAEQTSVDDLLCLPTKYMYVYKYTCNNIIHRLDIYLYVNC